MKTIHLTNTEKEILMHRLGVPDALADCLEEGFNPGDVYATADDLFNYLRQASEITVGQSAVADAILQDCVNGSTFLTGDEEDAIVDGTVSRGQVLNWRKAQKSLEQKLNAAGLECRFP